MAASTAAHKRRACRMPAAKRWNTLVWTAPMLRQLGKVPDLEIARVHGLAPMTVAAKRHELGIPRLIRTKVDWTSPRIRAQLGTMPDNALATALGVNPETVRLQRSLAGVPRFRHDLWTAAVIARLGGEPDRAIAGGSASPPTRWPGSAAAAVSRAGASSARDAWSCASRRAERGGGAMYASGGGAGGALGC